MQRRPENPCPSCGAFARVFKNGQSQCAYCGTALAPLPFTHPGGTFANTSPLRIGMTANISGKKHIAVGRLLFDQTDEDGGYYAWEEWVLLSQDGEARYLEFDEGKWTLTEAWPGGPDELPEGISAGSMTRINGDLATVTDAGVCRVRGLEGEIPWPVQVGNPLTFADFTISGQLLSAEFDPAEGELEWFRGRRLQPSDVFAMFGLKKEAEAEVGKENVLSDRRKFGCLTQVMALMALCGWIVGCNQHGKVVASQTVSASQIDGDGLRLGPFDLTGAGKVHRLRLSASGFSQSSIFVQALVEDAQGPIFDADGEFWDESGTDSDGAWHESDLSSQSDFKLAKAGPHYVNLIADPETAAAGAPVSVAIEQGVLHSPPLAWFGFLALPIGFCFMVAGAPSTAKAAWQSMSDDD
jgi:hypothetical protein